MKKRWSRFYPWLWLKALALSCFLAGGCSSLSPKTSETMRQAVYAARDAADAGRFDLVDDYVHQLPRLIPPPKHPIPVKPITR